jgi:hypothetical protein
MSLPGRSAPRRPPKAATSGKPRTGRGSASNLVVRQLARASDDGYEHDLVPGLRASADARRLADELAFAVARLEELRGSPPGLYADVAAAADPEEAAWLAFLIAYLSPLEDEAPFAGIEAARVPWATGELPVLDDVPLGPRAAHSSARGDATLTAYRARAAKAGSQLAALADPGLSPQRRFDRAFERLSLPGLHRAARFELLVLLGELGVIDIQASSLHFGAAAANDDFAVAAKRVFGIGDAMNVSRRASELAAGTGVPLAALDLALQNWARQPADRITAGSRATTDPQLRDRIVRSLGAQEAAVDSDGEQPAAPELASP